MTPVPFHLRYTLSRRQRLLVLYDLWGWFAPLIAIPAWLFFVLRTGWSIWTLEWAGIALFGVLALGVTCLYAGLFRGLVDLACVPMRQMDVRVEDNGAGAAAGILLGGERWYLFLDGITSIQRLGDVWSIQHHSGHVLWIAASAIADEQVDFLHDQMRRGQTPEGIQEVIQRGRRIEELMSADRVAP